MSARSRQRGQAMTEYTVVLAVAVLGLILGAMEPSPIQGLIDAIKSACAAFGYVISFST